MPNIPKIPNPPNSSRPGYEYLTCYMLGVVIQELTDEFCQKFLTPKHPNLPNPEFRQIQQMTQAARSNPQNVAEGYTQESLKGYIYLSGIAHGSNEELTKDYLRFLKKENLPIWPKNHPKVRVFRKFRVKWISPTTLNTPTLPTDPQEAANLLLTLCNMEGYLLKKLVSSLKQKHPSGVACSTPRGRPVECFTIQLGHRTQGGLTEKLYKDRKEYRGY